VESELFGHRKGAFTGATTDRAGKFEVADGGTLSLDEVGELPLPGQAKLLRVLQEGEIQRVGSDTLHRVDVRVIAATNRDLEKAVSEGAFRRDLYFRLHVVDLLIPPLRKRSEDVVELAVYFLKRYNSETGRRIAGFSPEALAQMQKYRWPGNIRELKNVVERAVVLSRGKYIEAEDLALTNLATAGDSAEVPLSPAPFEAVPLSEIERRHIIATLGATGWNKSRTSTILGIERSTLDRKIRRYEIKPDRHRRPD